MTRRTGITYRPKARAAKLAILCAASKLDTQTLFDQLIDAVYANYAKGVDLANKPVGGLAEGHTGDTSAAVEPSSNSSESSEGVSATAEPATNSGSALAESGELGTDAVGDNSLQTGADTSATNSGDKESALA